jgi:hypothetical protein
MLPLEGVTAPGAGPADALGDAPLAEAPRSIARNGDATGFDLLFAALLTGAPLGASSGASNPAGIATPLSADTGRMSPLDARLTAESAAYAARMSGVMADAASAATAAPAAVSVLAAPHASTLSDDATALIDGRTASDTPSTGTSGDTAETPSAVTSLVPLPTDHTAAMAAALAVPVPPVAPSTAVSETAAPASAGDAALDAVDPELRARIARVAERMQREFGHEVRVVEGVRSQARQDALYAQGRTAPGPVVTWTRDSAHRDGHAVDVTIDGGYDNPEAFRRLSRIAREEGLRSLGPRDPGHLELSSEHPGIGAPVTDSASQASADPVASPARVAQVAAVASVAGVASVARTASLARVAAPASSRSIAATATQASTTGAARTDASRSSDDPRSSATPAPGVGARVEDALARLTPSLAGARDDSVPVAAPAALSGVDMAARLEAVARVRDAQASQPLSRLVMEVPDASGGVDRIAVQMRGGRVDASLAIADPMAASRLASRGDILAQALESRGYEAGTLQVRASGMLAPESLDLTRLAGLALEREGARGVASFLQDVSGGGLRDRQGSPSRHPDSSHTPRDGSPREDTPRRQPKRDDPGAR